MQHMQDPQHTPRHTQWHYALAEYNLDTVNITHFHFHMSSQKMSGSPLPYSVSFIVTEAEHTIKTFYMGRLVIVIKDILHR